MWSWNDLIAPTSTTSASRSAGCGGLLLMLVRLLVFLPLTLPETAMPPGASIRMRRCCGRCAGCCRASGRGPPDVLLLRETESTCGGLVRYLSPAQATGVACAVLAEVSHGCRGVGPLLLLPSSPFDSAHGLPLRSPFRNALRGQFCKARRALARHGNPACAEPDRHRRRKPLGAAKESAEQRQRRPRPPPARRGRRRRKPCPFLRHGRVAGFQVSSARRHVVPRGVGVAGHRRAQSPSTPLGAENPRAPLGGAFLRASLGGVSGRVSGGASGGVCRGVSGGWVTARPSRERRAARRSVRLWPPSSTRTGTRPPAHDRLDGAG